MLEAPVDGLRDGNRHELGALGVGVQVAGLGQAAGRAVRASCPRRDGQGAELALDLGPQLLPDELPRRGETGDDEAGCELDVVGVIVGPDEALIYGVG